VLSDPVSHVYQIPEMIRRAGYFALGALVSWDAQCFHVRQSHSLLEAGTDHPVALP
jgi:hypothetical protein